MIDKMIEHSNKLKERLEPQEQADVDKPEQPGQHKLTDKAEVVNA